MDWSSFDDYLNRLERQGVSMNVASLVGHSTIRLCVMGDEERRATPAELHEMEQLVDKSMRAGAFGLSTGLVYWPGCWSDTEEIVALAKVAAKHQGIYVSHIRGERETNIKATKEAIAIGEAADIPVHISHMQSKYPAYGKAEEKLRLLHQARQGGIDVACDTEAFPWIYYEARVPLPPWPFKEDHEKFVAMLKDPETRAKLVEEMASIDPHGVLGRTGEGGIYQQRAWDRVWVYECRSDPSVEGKKISEIAAERQVEPEDVLFDLIVAENGKGPYVFVAHIEDDHHVTAPDPLCIFPSTDCHAVDLSKVPPRYMQYSQEWLSLFPRVLSRYVKEEGLMTPQEAIRKMTSFACQRFGIRDRGMIREGMWADVTIFDYDTIEARGTYEDPLELPRGIEYVLVNGQVAVEEEAYTGILAGRVLRH
jgi:N-acyl-D-aspartate/D-glutamate deacylase